MLNNLKRKAIGKKGIQKNLELPTDVVCLYDKCQENEKEKFHKKTNCLQTKGYYQ